MADVDEIADLLSPPPVVWDPAIIVGVPELSYDCQPLGNYDNLQWLGEPQYVLYDWPQIDAPPLALDTVPIPDSPLSNPGSADVVAAGLAAELTAATFSGEVSSPLGPGGGIVTEKSDAR